MNLKKDHDTSWVRDGAQVKEGHKEAVRGLGRIVAGGASGSKRSKRAKRRFGGRAGPACSFEDRCRL